MSLADLMDESRLRYSGFSGRFPYKQPIIKKMKVLVNVRMGIVLIYALIRHNNKLLSFLRININIIKQLLILLYRRK